MEDTKYDILGANQRIVEVLPGLIKDYLEENIFDAMRQDFTGEQFQMAQWPSRMRL